MLELDANGRTHGDAGRRTAERTTRDILTDMDSLTPLPLPSVVDMCLSKRTRLQVDVPELPCGDWIHFWEGVALGKVIGVGVMKRSPFGRAPQRTEQCRECGNRFSRDELQVHMDMKHPGWALEIIRKLGFDPHSS